MSYFTKELQFNWKIISIIVAKVENHQRGEKIWKLYHPRRIYAVPLKAHPQMYSKSYID